MMKLILIALSLSFSAHAETCNFNVTCSDFNLDFKSPSGDCTEDDMVVSLDRKGKQTDLVLPKNWYSPLSNMIEEGQVCKKKLPFPVYVAGKNHLMFLRYSGRPGYDQILAVLINTESGKVLDQKELGRIKRERFVAMKIKNGVGFRIPLVKTYFKEVPCDCEDSFMEGLMEVKVVGNKIQHKWVNH
ncbi:MAG: hypothetical protein V4598_05640 [Bdellovibrionota bacterium]